MKRMLIILLSLISVFILIPGGGAARAGRLPGSPAAPPVVDAPQSPIGTGFTYQGVVKKDGLPYSGSCSFAFSLWDSAAGGLQVGSTLTQTLTVSDGLFIANLDFGSGRFNGQQRWLEVKVRCPAASGAYVSLGRQELSAAPYALYATSAPWSGITSRPAGLDDGDNDTLAGLGGACGLNQVPKWNGAGWSCLPDDDQLAGLTCNPNEIPRWNGSAWVCSIDGVSLKNTLIVAQSGGQYTSINSALSSITNARSDNPYLIWVGPGVYTETFTLPSYVHLLGAGQEVTIIRHNRYLNAGGGTINLAAHSSLRDLTVENYGGGSGNIYTAIYATNGITDTLVQNVTARATGSAGNKQTIYVYGARTDTILKDVTAQARGAGDNYALVIENGAHARVDSGVYTALGGDNACGIQVFNFASLDADSPSISGTNAGTYNFGLELFTYARANLFGGKYQARAGEQTIGINITDSNLLADSIEVEATQAATRNYGLQSILLTGSMTTTLRDSNLLAAGGEFATGVYRHNSQFISEGNRIRAQDATDSTIGFHNTGTSPYQYASRLSGDRIEASAEAGSQIVGILNSTWLVADEVMAHAEDKLSPALAANVYGLLSTLGSVDLHGGVYQAEYGNQATGIMTIETNLNAWEVTALGSMGDHAAIGLACTTTSFCEIWGGSYRGKFAKSGAAIGIQVLNAALFNGQDFNAQGLAGLTSTGLEVPVPTPPNSINIHQAVLEGATNSVMAAPAPYIMVSIYNTQLIGGPAVPPAPAPPATPTIQCTLTSRTGIVGVTTNTGSCP